SEHNIVDVSKLKIKTQKAHQIKLPELFNTNIPHKEDKQKKNKAVLEWIILDNEALAAPQKKGFH
ncbi:5699_t:CDS:1, partial [Cetraspora pellucida]